MYAKDLRIGSLVLLEPTELDGKWPCLRRAWVCACDCGNTLIVKERYFQSGQRMRCDECALKFRAKNISKHGHSKSEFCGKRPTKTYAAWQAMKGRCNNPNFENYPLYGGRGITYCDRWESFENFLFDMGEAPSKEFSLDRIDSNGNYEPSNCRWADVVMQNNNTRSNTWIEYKGQRKTLSQWCDELDLKYNAAQWRYKKYNGDPEKTLNPIRGRYNLKPKQ